MMASFSSAVQWWEEWQLRVLVLGSLCVQCFLAFFAGARKLHIRPAYRLSIWLSYLGVDALAIYALATLFNRQRKVRYSSANGAHVLEVLWAPILLMHLGGQVSISAYDIEDNDLWKRHMLTAVSQVVVAVYVFCKSWSSSADKRLLAAAILLFILGIFKCLEKPLALKRASFKSLVSSSHPASRTETTNREVQLEEYIQTAREFVQEPPTQDLDGQTPHSEQLSRPDKLFVDLAYSYHERLTSLKSFCQQNDEAAYKALTDGLSNIFNLLYTKDYTMPPGERDEHLVALCCSSFTWLFCFLLPTAAIGLLHSSHKKTYKVADITVTFVLLYVTYFLDIYSLGHLGRIQWHGMVAQHSLLGFFARNKRHTWLMGIAGCLQCIDLLNQYWCMKPSYSSKGITTLVREHVKYGWVNYILDAESYWRFSDTRGHLTLERMECERVLAWSLDKPFDESILIWHVATDFCFHHKGTQHDHPESSKLLPRQVSNYMMHLLYNNSDMLMPGSRMNLFTTAYSELEHILHGQDLQPMDQGKLVQRIVDCVGSREGFIHDSWVLAQDLMQLGDEEKMWKVIRGVWVEMLCFSASRCRGYLHAKGLGAGGEYLSFVWLLMAHAGMETFPERQQRVHLRLPREERVSIAKQRIEEAARNEAAGVSTAEV